MIFPSKIDTYSIDKLLLQGNAVSLKKTLDFCRKDALFSSKISINRLVVDETVPTENT